VADGSVAYGSLPFKEQIAFFRNKKNVLTEHWTDLWQEQHDTGFMVAGANRIDLLADLRSAVDKAISDGTTLAEFRKDFDAIVARYGWSYNGGRNWRSRIIYETNLRTSYAAGRYQQLQALKGVRPFWRYRHSDSVQHPRPLHLAWNNLVLHADDPWWDRHYPPNGWGCQCTVEAMNARDLERLGKSGPDTAPTEILQDVLVGKNGPSPMTVETPEGVDPGFGYAPGRSAYEQLVQNSLLKATKLPALAGAEALAELLAAERVAKAIDDSYAALQLLTVVGAGLVASLNPTSNDVVVGALDPDTVRSLASVDAMPSSAPIVITGTTAGGILINGVPLLLRNARAVLLDQADGQLLYIDGETATDGSVRVVWIRPGTAAFTANSYAGDGRSNVSSLQARLDAGELQFLRGSL